MVEWDARALAVSLQLQFEASKDEVVVAAKISARKGPSLGFVDAGF